MAVRFSSPSPSSPLYNDEADYDWASDAVGSYEEEDDEEGYSEEENGRPPPLHPDILYGDECLYSLVRLVRGSTAGRKLKRTIFKLCSVLMLCTFPLIVIAYIEDRTFEVGQYFTLSPHGATLSVLMWLTAIPGFLLGAFSLSFIRYWASLCTNRLLLTNIIRIFVCVMLLYLFIVTYTVAVVFLTFGNIKRWQDSILLVRIFPFYLCTVIFICPLDLGILLYLMDTSYYLDEISDPASVIEEPDPPVDVLDLSDVTASQLILVLLSLPFLFFIQFFDFCVAVKRAVVRYFTLQIKRRSDALAAKEQAEAAQPVRRRGTNAIVRVYRTAKRLLGRLCSGLGGGSKTAPIASGGGDAERGEEKVQELRPQAKDRELEERLAREAAMEEDARKAERRALQLQAQRAEEDARLRREGEYRAELEAKALAEQRERELASRAPTLDVPLFKARWGETPAAGSFQCRLRALPELSALADHMRSMGFHVVFASVPAANECELGVCNIREQGTGPWFMARFLASQGTFSAVMKSEDPASAPAYVKKFALAKVLKIDSSSAAPRNP